MPVVTMSGNLASGAREVGAMVAKALGVEMVDQQLMVSAAQRCGVSVGSVAEHDERTTTFRQRVSSVINNFLERSAVASGADPLSGATGLEGILSRTYAEMAVEHEEPQISDEAYLETMTGIIRELAASGRIVILGRGGQMILADMPSALHVLCVAPPELRALRLAERDGTGLEEAEHRIAEGDKARAAFYRKFWKVDVRDPSLYDLSINTAKVSYEIAADLVVAAAQAKAATANNVAERL